MQTLETPISGYLNAFISVIFRVHGTPCMNFMNSGYTESPDYLLLDLNTNIADKELQRNIGLKVNIPEEGELGSVKLYIFGIS